MAKKIRIYGFVNRWVAYEFNYDVVKIIFDSLVFELYAILPEMGKQKLIDKLEPYRTKDFKYAEDDFVDIKFSIDDTKNYYSVAVSLVLNTFPNRDCYFFKIYPFVEGLLTASTRFRDDNDIGGLFYSMMNEILNNPYKFMEGGFPYLQADSEQWNTFSVDWERLKRYRLEQRINLIKKK